MSLDTLHTDEYLFWIFWRILSLQETGSHYLMDNFERAWWMKLISTAWMNIPLKWVDMWMSTPHNFDWLFTKARVEWARGQRLFNNSWWFQPIDHSSPLILAFRWSRQLISEAQHSEETWLCEKGHWIQYLKVYGVYTSLFTIRTYNDSQQRQNELYALAVG